jgi:hypothetical protein
MPHRVLCSAIALSIVLASSVAARAADKDDALAAIKKLADAPNYSWSTELQGGFGNQQPVEYKTEKDGYTAFIAASQQGDPTDIVMKGAQSVAKMADGWKSAAELQKAVDDAGGFSPELMVLFRMTNFDAPATQCKALLEKAANIKKTNDVFTADLAETSAKELATFKMPASMTANFPAMTVKDAKGTLKLWVKDGTLNKMEIHLTGARTFNDQDMPVDETTTVTIKDVGTTKLTVPDDAKKKLAQAATQPTTAPAKNQP